MQTKLLVIPQSNGQYLLSVQVKATKRSQYLPVSVRVLVDTYQILFDKMGTSEMHIQGHCGQNMVFDSIVDEFEEFNK